MIHTIDEFESILGVLKTEPLIAFDFETMPNGKYPAVENAKDGNKNASLHHKMCDVEGLSLRSENLPACYVPFKDTNISRVVLNEGIAELFKQDSLFVAHNMAFDAKISDYFFHSRPKNKFCTMVGYWYLNENSKKSKVALAKDVFGLNLIDYSTAKGLTDDDFVAYAERDAEFAWNLYHYLKDKLPSRLYGLASTLEMDFVDVLIDMCLHGMNIDIENLKLGEHVLTDKVLELEAKIYNELGEFNIGSPQQLCEKIYGIKITRKKGQPIKLTKLPGEFAPVKKWNHGDNLAKKAPSTDVKALEFLDTPAALMVKEYRGVAKLLETYATGYQKWIVGGKIYPAFNHVGTVSGRLSSDKPNMQNIPRERSHYLTNPDDEKSGWWLRDALFAPPGYKLIVADESQLEIRILAHFCMDPSLMAAILSGEDIHLATAKLIFEKEDISSVERVFAKTTNFGVIYGMSVPAIAERLKIDKKEAVRFYNRYFETFPGIGVYMDECAQTMADKGFVKTIIGRRRRIPEIYSPQQSIFQRAKRQTVNSIIQGSASDILKVAMVNINQELQEKRLDANILSQIHDELVIEVLEPYAEEVVEITKRHMEHPFAEDLKVPLVVNPIICNIWSEGK
jgi:DNA polymerase-1